MRIYIPNSLKRILSYWCIYLLGATQASLPTSGALREIRCTEMNGPLLERSTTGTHTHQTGEWDTTRYAHHSLDTPYTCVL